MTTVVLDTSALMAIVLGESSADDCAAAIAEADSVLISAGTLAEALIVAAHRRVRARLDRLLDSITCEVVAVTRSSALQVAEAHERWGKGVHPAGLNFGDCFAYTLAAEQQCRLLFVGEDFSRTDVQAAI